MTSIDKYKTESEPVQEEELNCLFCGQPIEAEDESVFCSDWCQKGHYSEN